MIKRCKKCKVPLEGSLKLKDERTLRIVEIILGLILLITIVLQYVDSEIEGYNDKINKGGANLSRYLQIASYHHQKVGYWELTGMLADLGKSSRKELLIEEDPIAIPESIDEESKKLMNKYLSNEIDAYVYIQERGNLSRKKAEYYDSRVDSVRNSIQTLEKNPPLFLLFNIFSFKNVCLIIQLILVCIAISLLGSLLIKMSKRTSM